MVVDLRDTTSPVAFEASAAAGVAAKRSNANTYDQGETWRASIRCELARGLSKCHCTTENVARTHLARRNQMGRACASTAACRTKQTMQNAYGISYVLSGGLVPCVLFALQHSSECRAMLCDFAVRFSFRVERHRCARWLESYKNEGTILLMVGEV